MNFNKDKVELIICKNMVFSYKKKKKEYGLNSILIIEILFFLDVIICLINN